MAKPFLFAAAVANFFLIVSSGNVHSQARSSASSNSGHASATAFAHAESFAINHHGQKPTACGKNEVFTDCEQAECGPKTCAQLRFPVRCFEIDRKFCKKACICKEGYVRNKYGKCIPKDKCPPICGPHEFPSNCTQADCSPQYCTQVGFPLICVRVDLQHCKKGCLCEEHYARDSDGVCIPIKKCPSCGGDPNAEYVDCASNCGRYCSNYNDKNVVCPLVCAESGCQCKKTYVYDSNTDRCVLPCDCTPTCGPHEVYSTCTQAECRPQNCNQLGFPIVCPRIDPKYCEEGCLCKPGYVRNSAGVCVPLKECPSCGGDPNAEGAECASNCGKLCSDYDTNVVCTLECVLNGCQCRKGLVYDTNTDLCVPPCDCTPTCGPHEVYSNCTQAECRPQNCSQLGFPIACPRIDPKYCEKGCLCKPGYVRNSAGVCVPLNKCPSCGGDPNAEGAICASNCGNLCSNYNETNVVCTLECVENGCQCKKKYVYDSNTDRCVLPCDCTPTCGPHEVYSTCTQVECRPQNCSQLGFPIACPRIDPKYCEEGCLCKTGYVRNSAGVCVPLKECPSCGGDPNAEGAVCASNCGNLCSNYNETNVVCTLECALNGCQCRKGLVYDTNTGRCVQPCDCTPVCKEYEVYSNCINHPCPVINCSHVGLLMDCLQFDTKDCIKGCVCREPLMREEDGSCVPIEECKTPVCKKNEVYSECTNGGCSPRNCSQIGLPIKCVKIDPKYCEKGCICKEGYLREDDGTCVPEKKCKKRCTKPNEYYEPCGYDCPSQSCKSINKTQHCPLKTEICKPSCKCIDGYFRNLIGECISKKHCLQCPGPNEYWSCGGACDNVCKDLHKQNQTNCPIVNIDCNKMCYCKKDYARAKNGTCIPIDKCNEPQCGKNERYEKCPARLIEPQKCSELGYPLPDPPCSDDDKCCEEPACVCIKGYVKNNKGDCIPKKDCPSCGGDPNAEGAECASNCGNLCSNYNDTNVVCTLECIKNGCQCKKKYVYDSNTGRCVLPCDCTPVCKKNEVYSECTNGGCSPKNCSQIGLPIKCVKIDPKYCEKGCICKEGYLRDDDGTCVPEKKCKKPQCGKNERYEQCPARLTEPQKCSELGYPLPDPPCSDDDKCCEEPACVCIKGYVKNNKGDCIPKKDCPSCGGDPNAEGAECASNCGNLCSNYNDTNVVLCYLVTCSVILLKKHKKDIASCGGDPNAEGAECASNCGNLCSNYNDTNVVCTLECIKNGCQCKKKYVYDSNTGRCVLPCDCTPVCKKNEVYSECTNGGCSPKNCSQIGLPIKCVKIDPKYCEKGCICKEGYLRDDDGTCVPEKKCKKPQCGKNERYEQCPARLTEPQKCSELGYPLPDPPCSDDDKCCEEPACVCIKGYVKNNKGDCIPKKDCPSCGGDPNAEGAECASNCGNLCSNYNDTNVVCTLECVKNGCQCKKKYVYDSNTGRCVLPCDCTPVCKKNEVYSECTNGGCSPRNCSQIGLPIKCVKIDPKYCEKGCICKEGYFRDDDGTCVPEKKCKNVCTKPNEYLEECDYGCPPNTCDSLDRAYVCPIREGEECVKQCKCKPGFYRNKIGECITEKQCRKCPGPNEYWSCGGACDNVCKDLYKQNQTNCPIINVDCNKMCYCIKDYARAMNGTCIPIDKCNEPQCGKNERYEKCPSRLTEPQKCSELGKPLPDPPSCDDDKCRVEPACVCIKDYVRNEKGDCIPKKDCPKVCKGDNEVYEDCTNPSCRPTKCDEVGFPLNCTEPPACEKGCVCKDGHVRNKKGICVTLKECGTCGGDDNAESGSGVNCLKKCYDLQNPDNPKPCPKIWKVNACDCKKDYYLDEVKNKCVLAKDCHICTKPNEYLEECDYGCPPNTCDSLDRAYVCPIREGEKCVKRCKCKPGFYRNKIGECITEKQCRKCPGPDEYWSCGGACDNVCKDLHKQNQTNCPIINVDCNKMCYCIKDYARAMNGTCIPIDKCNEPQCGKNERYEKCPSRLTEPQKCCELGKPLPDPPSCDDDKCREEPACVCIEDYVRNEKGDCIPKKDCPKVCKGDNEVYEDCTNPSCRPTKCDEVGFPLNCTEPPACEKGCVCKDGHVRNKKGICVTLKECGTCGGDDNAESGSGVNCLKKCYDLQNPDNPKPCPKIWKVNACDCKKDYYLDEVKNKCVLAKDCPHSCPKNEVHDRCKNGGCGHRNCSQLGGPILCIDPIECIAGCTCKEGYLRLDATGECVPKDQCPESCNKPNEIYVKCPPKCPQTCKSLNESSHCPVTKTKKKDSDCVGACVCKENYYRNLIGECICKEDCLKCTGDHEYFSCGPACDNVCCDLDKQSKDNCPIKNKKCVNRCYCEDGYARDKDGVCICISDCPDRTTTTPKPAVNTTLALKKFEQGNIKMTIEFLKILYNDRPGENIMISILSILTVLAQITLPALGDALKQLLSFQNLSNKQQIRAIYPIIMDKLNGQEHVTLAFANKIYGNNIYPFTKQFKQDASVFESDVENIDFSQNVAAAENINGWVSNKTNGLIDNLVNPDMFSAQTRLAIFNCIYFLGNWVNQFDPDKTRPRDFYINDKETVSIPTMYQQGRFKYLDSNDLDAECVLLPYKGGENSLLICIPKEIEGLKAMLYKFEYDTLDQILDSLEEEKLDMYIPKFKFPTNLSNLKELLIKIGLKVIFEESNDFDGIFENGEKLLVTDMMQKSQMDVDETGTEAAVSSGLIVGTTSVQIVRKFEWNRPGAFFLLSKGHLLLSGIYAGAQE